MAEVVDYNADSLTNVTMDFLGRGGNLADLAPNVAEILVAALEDVFENQGAVGGRPEWEPSQRAEAQGGQTLQDTGNLAGSIESEWDADSAFAGSDVPYGKYHLPGPGKSGERKVPVRDWTAIDFDAVTDEVAEFILSEIMQ